LRQIPFSISIVYGSRYFDESFVKITDLPVLEQISFVSSLMFISKSSPLNLATLQGIVELHIFAFVVLLKPVQ